MLRSSAYLVSSQTWDAPAPLQLSTAFPASIISLSLEPVSYTHLDVYKRQFHMC